MPVEAAGLVGQRPVLVVIPLPAQLPHREGTHSSLVTFCVRETSGLGVDPEVFSSRITWPMIPINSQYCRNGTTCEYFIPARFWGQMTKGPFKSSHKHTCHLLLQKRLTENMAELSQNELMAIGSHSLKEELKPFRTTFKSLYLKSASANVTEVVDQLTSEEHAGGEVDYSQFLQSY